MVRYGLWISSPQAGLFVLRYYSIIPVFYMLWGHARWPVSRSTFNLTLLHWNGDARRPPARPLHDFTYIFTERTLESKRPWYTCKRIEKETTNANREHSFPANADTEVISSKIVDEEGNNACSLCAVVYIRTELFMSRARSLREVYSRCSHDNSITDLKWSKAC